MPSRPLAFDPIEEARGQWVAHGWRMPSHMAAATSVMRAQQIVLGRVDAALRPFGLTFARYEVLVLLHFSRRGSLPLGKMGDLLMVHPASITNAIDRLERDGLVRRTPHPTDGRTVLAEITRRRARAGGAGDVRARGHPFRSRRARRGVGGAADRARPRAPPRGRRLHMPRPPPLAAGRRRWASSTAPPPDGDPLDAGEPADLGARRM